MNPSAANYPGPLDEARAAQGAPSLRRIGGLSALAVTVAALLALPVLSVGSNVLRGGTSGTWAHLLSTVLPDYIVTTLWLCAGVALLTAVLGVGTAWLVTHFDFPLRRTFDWMLVLPLAMPAYVMAYTYTDLLQFVGPVQSTLRELTGWTRADYRFPEVRSTGGAMWMLSLVLYPYVYMLTRTAFLERGGALLEAARAMGLGPWQRLWRVSLPMARPAIAAGVALALMETLADYGVVSYFAVQTFTTGIYRAWFSLGDRVAAAQLAMCLLGFVLLLLALERQSRGAARFHGTGLRAQPQRGVPLTGWRATAAMSFCALPVLLGFALPCALLMRWALTVGDAQFGLRFIELARHSVTVAGLTAVLAVLVAVLVAYARRLDPSPLTRWAHAAVSCGYALPGSVIAVGVLIPLAQFDNALALWLKAQWGWNVGLMLTGSIAALVFACVVRFASAALQTTDAALHRITPHMDDAARSLGLSASNSLRRVHLPLLRRSLLTAGLLVFIDTMKELPATLVMRPFNFDTLATQAYTLASDERLAEASTASLAIVAVGLLPLILLCRQIAREGFKPRA
jgi:iron(III) transport system permease protein